MRVKQAPIVAVVALAAAGLGCGPANGQGLPPTNMGKWVRQPGDNQYTVQTQMQRHGSGGYIDTGGGGSVYVKRPAGAPPLSAASPVGGGGGGGVPMGGSVSGPKVDISLEPIAADEPVPPAGFPPLPERLDLPVAMDATWGSSPGKPGNWANSPTAAGGGGPAVGGKPQPTGVHQHYKHYQAGAFARPTQEGSQHEEPSWGGGGSHSGGGGGHSGGSPTASGGGGGIGYYKARTPAPIGRPAGEVFASDARTTGKGATAASPIGREGSGPGGMGKAPELDPKQDDAAQAPEAPTPVVVSQSTTQDLSLPDDDFTSKQFQNSRTKRFVKQTVRQAGRAGARAGRRAVRRATGVVGF